MLKDGLVYDYACSTAGANTEVKVRSTITVPYLTFGGTADNIDIHEIIDDRKVNNMRKLYQIIVVDPATEEIMPIGDEVVPSIIAKNREQALLKVGLPPVAIANIDDFDIICVELGDVRAKKEAAKVKVVK